MTGRIYSSDKAFNAFGKWVVLNGGFIHESLVFTPPDGDSQYGARVVTTSALPPNSCLMICPYALAIDYAKARAKFSRNFIESTTQHAALCLFLCSEWLKGKGSLWWPYLRLLPREFDTPLYFSEEDLKYLQGCNLDVKEVETRKRLWKEELGTALEVLKEEGINTDGYTWELYLWGATTFTSRSFPGKLMNWGGHGPSEGDDIPALFPLIDSLNHYPVTRVTWQTGDSALSIISGAELAEGVEVYNNYGPKPNDELLMGYGFTLPSNPFDAVLLHFSLPLTSTQQTLYALQSPHTTPGLYHLTPRNHTPTTPSIYPPALLNLFHILTATQPELSLLQSAPTAETITLRNTLSTHSQLLLAIRRKLQQIPPTLPPPQNSKQASATHYRESQLAILTSAIVESTTVLHSAITSNKLITLRSALSSSPLFNRAVESCFGTCDPAELQDSQQDEIVLILYICHLLLTHRPSLSFTPTPQKEGEQVPEEIKQLHADIFPSAATAAPEIFGGEAWTEQLLNWGMRTYTNCGVTLPVSLTDDGDEEEGAVFGVCLE